jgi:Putative lumazine-binding
VSVNHPQPTIPAAPDYDEIASVVRDYVDTFNDCDADKARRAFHEDAWIFCPTDDGTLEHELIGNQFDEYASDPDLTVVPTIISVIQAGDIASVLLGFDAEGEPAWVDLLTSGAWTARGRSPTRPRRTPRGRVGQAPRRDRGITGRARDGTATGAGA